jgi:hypothetical protein
MTADPTIREEQPPEEDEPVGSPGAAQWTSLVAFLAALAFVLVLVFRVAGGDHPVNVANFFLATGALIAGTCAGWRRIRSGGGESAYRRLTVFNRVVFCFERGTGAPPPLPPVEAKAETKPEAP